ncbi:MAG: cytochrome-c oxidase, cbb3-type subunit II [Gemmatimonadota bacterium]
MANDDKGQHQESESAYGRFHRRVLEGRGALFAVATTLAISVGGLVEIVPMFSASWGPDRTTAVTPYTPLEVAGRDIYISEGCNTCHSQMVRPMRAEILRYGEWTRAWEYTYDRPFLLGSRRLGPDLQRVGGKYPDAWHYQHMENPRAISPGSIMPGYPWMLRKRIDPSDVTKSVRALSRVGHPYPDVSEDWVTAQLQEQGGEIVSNLETAGIETEWDTRIVALIAYLQRLGTEGRQILEERERTAADPAPGEEMAATPGSDDR